jgi:hypothetical protein
VKHADRPYLRQVKYKYKLSPADYYALFELQGGRCAICHVTPEEMGRRLAVDHNHLTGEVRGLLCSPCNSGLGAHELRGTSAWSAYRAWPPMKELLYRRNTPIDDQVHPL